MKKCGVASRKQGIEVWSMTGPEEPLSLAVLGAINHDL